MKFNPEVFREYDVRGVVEKDLTSDFALELGLAVGTLCTQTLCQNHDHRQGLPTEL